MISRIGDGLRWLALAAALQLVSGCAGVARGVTEAVIEESRRTVAGYCAVEGKAFVGIGGYRQPAKPLKLLMVHGVGDYRSGYSDALARRLADELGFDQKSRLTKVLDLSIPRSALAHDEALPGPVHVPLGQLRVSRFSQQQGPEVMLVYELLWNPLSLAEKQLLLFDASSALNSQRASLNRDLKQLLNAHIADPLIYLGPTGNAIRSSVTQSLCTLADSRWDELPPSGRLECDPGGLAFPRFGADPTVIISHSMGSRIVLDAVGDLASHVQGTHSAALLRQRVLPVFMLSNQLQLLQLGRPSPPVVDERASYCGPLAPRAEERHLKRLEIVAVTDPNDLLSYPVPQAFVDDFIDSRLCAELTNVAFTVTNPVDLFGIGQLAMPMDAHKGYLDHAELTKLLAHGLAAAPGIRGLRSCSRLALEGD